MIGQTVSHYRIIELLGEGGMGTVYAAEDTRLGRRVAIKIPHAAPSANNFFHARFLREARSVSALSHPHIATVFDYGETEEGRPFIVMELVQGSELGEVMHEGGLTMTRTLEIVEDVAEALCEAHRRGIVHRDVKPSNVIINERGEVKVLDFGLAKLVGDESERSGSDADALMHIKTRSDVMLGTPLYLSPEQAKGVHVDPRSDLFALGALLYECLTGQPAFAGATVVEIAAQVIHVNPPPPSQLNANIPPELDSLVMRLLAKRPEERYQSAEEVVADLRVVRRRLSEEDDTRLPERLVRSGQISHASALVTLSDNLRRPRLSIAAAAGAVVLLLAGFFAYRYFTRPAPHVPPPEAAERYRKGVEMLRDGAYWQASRTLQRAVELDDRYAHAHASLAEALTELDYTERASNELLTVNKLVPDRTALPERDRLYLEAVTATATRDFAGAVRAYEEIARRWPGEAHVHVDLGRAYEKAEDVKRAADCYRRATELNTDYATAYLRIGNLYARRLDYESAEAALRRAEEIYGDMGVAEGRTEVLYLRGSMFRTLGRLAEARELLRQALVLARTTGNEAQQINALSLLSAVAYTGKDWVQAADHAREAVELAQAQGMDTLTALGLVSLGNSYFASGNYDEAEKHFRRALDIAGRNKATRVEAKARANLGSLLIQQGVTGEGERFAGQAHAFYQQGGYRKETAEVLTILARANRQKGNYADALRALQEQSQLAEEVGDRSLAALSHSEIATILGQQGRYAEALHHLEVSYKIDEAQGNQLRLGYTLLGRVDMLWSLGRYADARALLAQAPALAAAPDDKNRELLAEMRLTAAGMALSERRFPEARAGGIEAIALGGKNKKILVRAKLAQALALANTGGAAAARALCEEAAQSAREASDPWLLSNARLALAQVLVEGGDAALALEHALAARESFARAEQREAEWRASLVAARAAARAGDQSAAQQHAARAGSVLAELQQAWGTEVFNTYQARPDVQVCRRQLAELSAPARSA